MKRKNITVKVIAKSIGGIIVEPACKQSETLCRIAATNCLSSEQLFLIQRLGFSIKVLS